MDKEKYTAPEVEIVKFDNEDIITTSNEVNILINKTGSPMRTACLFEL